MRCRKSDTIRGRPLRSGTLGSQPSNSLALVMSGFLLCGSSSVFGLNSIFALWSIVSFTTCQRTNDKTISYRVPFRELANLISFFYNLICSWCKDRKDQSRQAVKHCLKRMSYENSSLYLSKFKHGEFTRISKIERSHMVAFHQTHQALHLLSRAPHCRMRHHW